MSDTLKCPKCGEENPRANKFCDSCGAKLAAAASPAAREESKAPEKKKAKPVAEKQVKETRAAEPVGAAVESEDAEVPSAGLVINWETLAWTAIILACIILRFADLGTKPLHHDESMHAFYGYKLFKGEGYSYNPMMHGPFHYHANALIYFLFGTSDYTSRVAPAIFGVIGVVLVWFLRPFVGRLGAVFIALIIAVSPTFVYQSRFIREDIFMAVDTLAMFVGLMRYFTSRKPAWLYLAATALAFSWATKEATYITLFVMGIFLIFRYIWEYSYRNVPDKAQKEGYVYPTVQYWLKDGKKEFLTALAIFVLVHGALFFGKEP
ncbi:MAG TPA: TIGR03663 family protein, partial [Candidatus Goldiibacteriota bacterium]|nr:TIGR03663 family protein [Candidatus Goldiibacteriota bacterium]